ncbi:MAG: GNAT family N-acetyltransferase [Sporichthyaceae bacterium]
MSQRGELVVASRELTGALSPQVLTAGPPPVPALSQDWTARLVRPDGPDLELLHTWMHRPHVATRWEQAWSRASWSAALTAQLAGEHSRPWIISGPCEGRRRDLAYVEIYRPARDVLAEHYDADPHDLGVHLAIGEEELTGQGLGTVIVAEISNALLRAEAACTRIVADPEAAHLAARAMFTRAAFVLHAEVDLPHKRAALMLRLRS